jgi:iron complex transport system substrate-binding protein
MSLCHNGIMRPRVWIPLLLASLLAGTGCQAPQPIGGKPREIASPRIVSISPSATEMLSKAGIYNTLAGRSANCNFPMNFSKVPVVMNGTTPDYEKIAGLKAQVLLYDGALYGDSQVSKFKDMGMQLVKWDPNTLKEYERDSFTLANAVGGEMMMSEYMDGIYRAVAEARGSLEQQGLTGARIAILIGRPGQYLAPGTKSLWGDLTERVGGKLVGGDSSRFEPISLEELVKANPQVIISAGGGKAIYADPALKSVEAIQKKRVYDIEEDVLLRRGARIDQLVEAIGTGLAKVK